MKEIPMIQKSSQIRFWSMYARVYDGLLELRPYADLIADSVGELDVGSESVVVDLGCGTGNCMNEVLDTAGPRVERIIGVDSSPQMLNVARRKLAHHPAVEFVNVSLLEWLTECPSGSIDNAISVNVLYTMGPADRKTFWEGLARVLSDRGNAVVVTTDRPGFGPVAREHLSRVPIWRAFSFRLLTVLIMNLLIWLFESTDEYDPVDLDQLVSEAQDAGLNVTETKRCYGGEVDGVDVMLVLVPDRIDLTTASGSQVSAEIEAGDGGTETAPEPEPEPEESVSRRSDRSLRGAKASDRVPQRTT